LGGAGRFFQYALPEHPTKLFYVRWDLKGEINVLWDEKVEIKTI
jgi:hypothetical protein|tara:strand:- start:436 stop:567 length:132 start_codon:yes stop_codon:yes gene_type:complete